MRMNLTIYLAQTWLVVFNEYVVSHVDDHLYLNHEEIRTHFIAIYQIHESILTSIRKTYVCYSYYFHLHFFFFHLTCKCHDIIISKLKYASSKSPSYSYLLFLTLFFLQVYSLIKWVIEFSSLQATNRDNIRSSFCYLKTTWISFLLTKRWLT